MPVSNHMNNSTASASDTSPSDTSHAPHSPITLSEVIQQAHPVADGYAGDIPPTLAWQFLAQHDEAFLIDVRTQPEWQFTGTPNLHAIGATFLPLSWKYYPDFRPNTDFAKQLENMVTAPETPLFFICRTGGRSLDAAIAMTSVGYAHCFNIEGGFEGEQNSEGHRGLMQGWKAANLPWAQQ